MNKHLKTVHSACLVAATFVTMAHANAGVITTSTFMFELPPGTAYVTVPGAQLCYSPGAGDDVCIVGVTLSNFAFPVFIQLPDDTRINFAGVEFSGQTTSPAWALGPVTMDGPIVAQEEMRSADTGTFQTELTQLSLSGVSPLGPLMIQESPTLQSLGQITISNIGGGQYLMDSFFDVFTEISFDGGKVWYPSDGATRFQLPVEIPEPESLPLVASALAFVFALLCKARRVW